MDKRLIFIFFDGVGLGENDPASNPLVSDQSSFFSSLLNGHRLTEDTPGFETDTLLFRPLDPCLGVKGTPQSATGQAAIITGKNIPMLHGSHYGPKPNQFIREQLAQDNLFIRLNEKGLTSTMVNAYPEKFLRAIESGVRLPGTFGLSYLAAGNHLKTQADLERGDALSADYTGLGWHNHLGITTVPLLTLQDAAHRLMEISHEHAFTFFEIWVTDIFGHRQAYDDAVAFLRQTDEFLQQLVTHLDLKSTSILITSDHGNMENLSIRRHTRNQVPGILIGNRTSQDYFSAMQSLVDLTPAIIKYLLS